MGFGAQEQSSLGSNSSDDPLTDFKSGEYCNRPPKVGDDERDDKDLPISLRHAVVLMCTMTHVHGAHKGVEVDGDKNHHHPITSPHRPLKRLVKKAPSGIGLANLFQGFNAEPIFFGPIIEPDQSVAGGKRRRPHDAPAKEGTEVPHHGGVEQIIETVIHDGADQNANPQNTQSLFQRLFPGVIGSCHHQPPFFAKRNCLVTSVYMITQQIAFCQV